MDLRYCGLKLTASFLLPLGLQASIFLMGLSLYGCVSQQADLKHTERDLQRRIKQNTEELAQSRARQDQEIVRLHEQDIPALRGDIDKALQRMRSLEARLDDLHAKLESRMAAQTSKLDHRVGESGKRAAENGSDQKSHEARLEQHEELISSLLLQVQELSRLVKGHTAP